MLISFLTDIHARRFASISLELHRPSLKQLRWICVSWAILSLLASIPWNSATRMVSSFVAFKPFVKPSWVSSAKWSERVEEKRRLRAPNTRGQSLLASKTKLTTVTVINVTIAPFAVVSAPSNTSFANSSATVAPVNDGNLKSSSGTSNANASSSSFSGETIPAIMVGIATSVIVCALFLYVTDLKDRCRHEDWVRAHQERQRQQQPALIAPGGAAFQGSTFSFKRDSQTSSSTGEDRQSVSSSRGMQAYDSVLLPPMVPDEDDLLDSVEIMCLEYPVRFRSFSQISTITGSCIGDGSPNRELMDGFESQHQSLGITELDDIYRLPQNADLTSLVMQRQVPSPYVSQSTSSQSSGLDSQDEMIIADPIEYIRVISEAMSISSQEGDATNSLHKEAIGTVTIIGVAPQNSDGLEIGLVEDRFEKDDEIVYEDLYIMQIGRDDVHDTSLDCNEGEDGGTTVCSVASSSTESVSVISDSESTTPQLLGEMMTYASDVTPTRKNARSVYEISPDIPNLSVPLSFQEESRDVDDNCLAKERYSSHASETEDDHRIGAPLRSEMTNLEELISSIPFDQLEERVPFAVNEEQMVHNAAPLISNEYVRDLYFVPLPQSDANDELVTSETSSSTLGLELCDASSMVTHPVVAKVAFNSPLVGRIFEGDIILRVNDAETAGLSGDNVYKLIQCIQLTSNSNGNGFIAKMIKLTVMSSQSDASNVVSDESIDLGILETALEV